MHFELVFQFVKLLLLVGYLQLRLDAFDSGYHFLLAGIELRLLDVIPGFHDGGQAFFLSQVRFGAYLVDLSLCGLQRGLELCEILFGSCLVKLDHNIALFYRSAIASEFHYLEVTRLGRSHNRQRFQSLHLAAKLKRVDKLSPRHHESWKGRCSIGIADSPKESAARQQDHNDHPRFSLIPQLANARGHRSAPTVLFCPARSTSTAAERSGISLTSRPASENTTAKARSQDEQSPLLPIGAISSSLPGNTRSGYASRCMRAD